MTRKGHEVGTLVLLGAVVMSAAQAPSSQVVTTSSGVYTASQAARGEQSYMASCVSCHPAGTYSTPAFREQWNGRRLSDLYVLVRDTMPKEHPESLEPNEYAQIIAYMLKINGAPPGKTELTTDVKALRRIRISLSAAAPRQRGVIKLMASEAAPRSLRAQPR